MLKKTKQDFALLNHHKAPLTDAKITDASDLKPEFVKRLLKNFIDRTPMSSGDSKSVWRRFQAGLEFSSRFQ